jgi:hypothetical protein
MPPFSFSFSFSRLSPGRHARLSSFATPRPLPPLIISFRPPPLFFAFHFDIFDAIADLSFTVFADDIFAYAFDFFFAILLSSLTPPLISPIRFLFAFAFAAMPRYYYA